ITQHRAGTLLAGLGVFTVRGTDMRTQLMLPAAALLALGMLAGWLVSNRPQVLAQEQKAADPHGWLGTETVNTRFGNFEFKNGYPTRAAADALLDQQKSTRAVEIYLTPLRAVSIIETRRGIHEFGAKKSYQAVIWEQLMDAQTLVLTANTETVYGNGFLDL